MIDILRSVPRYVSIDVTVDAQFTDAFPASGFHPSHGLPVINPFARVFCYGAVFQKGNGRETTKAVERRVHDTQSVRRPFHS
jgi:hypothetical protein